MSNYFSGRLVFDHIPKTAGSSIVVWIASALGSGSISPSNPKIYNLSHLDLISRFGGLYPIITGHLTFLNGDDLDPRWMYMTILREPIDRCLSWLYYNLEMNAGGIKEFIESDGVVTNAYIMGNINNYCCKHFSSINNTQPLDGEAALSAAISNISRYDMVGFQEDLSSFLDDLANIVGINPLHPFPRSNITKSRKYSEDISPQLHKYLVELNNLDIDLYNSVLDLKQEKRQWNIDHLLKKDFVCQKFEHSRIGLALTSKASHSPIVTDVKGSIVLTESIGTLHIQQAFSIKIELTNQSSQKWGGDIFHPVNVSYHWMDTDGNVVVYNGKRTAIADNGYCDPKSKKSFKIDLIAPSFAGNFILLVTLVQENKFWFESSGKDFSPAKIEVIVKGDGEKRSEVLAT